MIPTSPVLIAKASEHVDTSFLEDAVTPFYEFSPVLGFHVVEAAHVENEIELFILKR